MLTLPKNDMAARILSVLADGPCDYATLSRACGANGPKMGLIFGESFRILNRTKKIVFDVPTMTVRAK
jgi:hypothetical protein